MMLAPFFALAQPEESKFKVGDRAPNFEGVDQNQSTFSLENGLTAGSVLVVFYRGEWCGYCNRYLSELMERKQEFDEMNIHMVGISPETEENRSKTIEESGIDFPVLVDKDHRISDAFGLTFDLDEKTKKRYEGYGIDLTKANGNDRYALPVPATYLIDQQGIIQFIHYDPDYSNRANIDEILKVALEEIK